MSENHARPWFSLTFRYLSRVISFPMCLNPRTMQDLGSAFSGFAFAKAPFSCSSGSEGTNTNLPELVPPRSPLKVFRAAVAFLNQSPKGVGLKIRGSSSPWWGRGPCTWCQRPVELGASWQFSFCGLADWPSLSPLGSLALP